MADISIRSETQGDNAPLTPACIKALVDKMEDKRKIAAIEIEKMTFEFSSSNNEAMINRLITVLGKNFCLSHNPNIRKGGLIGLAAVMIGFNNGSKLEPKPEMVKEAVRPILTCFLDSDSRVRYYACESLCNVTKVAKKNILTLFEGIFDNLSKIVADTDPSVRGGAEMLDRSLKDIIVEEPKFDIREFVPRLQEYIYTMNSFTRMFIVSWVRFLDSRIDMLEYLPQLLDGLFTCLYDSTEEIKASTLNLLSEFLNKIVLRPTDRVDLPSMIDILLKHAKNDREDPVQYTAIAWLRQFIVLMDDQDLIGFTPNILPAILPCIANYANQDGSVTSSRDRLSPNPMSHRLGSPSQGNVCEISSLVNSSLLDRITKVLSNRKNIPEHESSSSDFEPILEALARELQKHEHPVTKIAILHWLMKLNAAEPDFILASTFQHKIFQILLETLSDRSDVVVKNTLKVIAEVFCVEGTDDQVQAISSTLDETMTITKEDDASDVERKKPPPRTQTPKSPNSSAKKVAISAGDNITGQSSSTNIGRFVQALCKKFREKNVVFEDRGTFIIINLCSIVRSDTIYKSFAEMLREEKEDLKFAHDLVQKLNQILLTTQPLYGLRSRLTNEDDPEMVNLFHNLYYAWCYSPIAVLTLCLLTNNYRHASEIVNLLSQTEISVDILSQIDWVIQLIESPVFASLRMRLLDVNSNQYLIQSLYGLLMILPQSEAYRRLSHRLDQVHKYMCAQPHFKAPPTSQVAHNRTTLGTAPASAPKKTNSATTFEAMIRHFSNIQSQRAKFASASDKDD